MNISLDIIQSISDFLNSGFMDILKNFLAIIPKILYFIIACIMSLIDLFQVMFRKLAGLDQIIISGEVTTGDSIYQIMMDALFTGKYPAINTAFWAILILGVFMLIVTCIIATIRLEYNPDKEKGNSKGAIVKNFFKALFSFAIVPIACIFGMAIANSLVGIIDQVTAVEVEQTDNVYSHFDQWTGIEGTSESNVLMENKASYIAYDIFGITVPTTAEPFSGMVFKASAYSCNRFRLYGSSYLAEVNASGTDLGIFSTGQVGDYETAAQIVDTGFAINAKLKGGSYTLDYTDEIEERYKKSISLFGSTSNITNFSKYNVEMVWYFYDLWTFNYIVGFAAVIIIGKLYFQFCLVLMARLFEIAGLFLVAPIPIAIMPMDGGGAMARWRGSFIGKFGLLVIMVFGLNIVSPVLSIIQEVKLFGLPLLDNIVLAMFLVAALNAVNSLNNTFSTILFDKASAYKDSMDLAKDASSNIQGGLKATLSAGRVATALPLAAAHAGVKVGGAVIRRAPQVGYNMVRGGRQMINRGRERREIRNATRFDQQAASSRYQGMKAKERQAAADAFMHTKAGKAFVDEYNANMGFKAGTTSNARGALVDDERNIKHKDGTIDNHQYVTEEQREEFQRFMHDKEMFDKSDEAKKYTAGSQDYYDALDKYREMSKRQQTTMFEGNSAPLSRKQQDIQAKRAAANSMKDYKDTKFGKWSASAGGWTKGVAKKVGKFNENHVKPFVDRAAGGLQGVIDIIPGMELFPRKGKK